VSLRDHVATGHQFYLGLSGRDRHDLANCDYRSKQVWQGELPSEQTDGRCREKQASGNQPLFSRLSRRLAPLDMEGRNVPGEVTHGWGQSIIRLPPMAQLSGWAGTFLTGARRFSHQP
jgi:hypothetical protein